MHIKDFPEIVDQYYRMNPETDEVLFDGTELRPGMIVLIETPLLREDISNMGEITDGGLLMSIEAVNRWCLVSQPTIVEGEVKFVAIYADGYQQTRRYRSQQPWLVKKETRRQHPAYPN